MSAKDLQTTARLVAWRINMWKQSDYIESKHFMIGKWCWNLQYSNSYGGLVTLNPIELQSFPSPIVSFVVHVFSPMGSRITARTEVEKIRKSDCSVMIDTTKLHGTTPITVCLEFLDSNVEEDGKSYSIWDEDYLKQNSSNEPIQRMLADGIYSDIIINVKDGSIKAHRAVLAASSPVFNTMFSENYLEKQTSTVNISDMSIGACTAMLNFVYGKRESNELRTHHIEVILAADKYDIMNLKEACEIELCKDVGAKNVFERLVLGHTYDLPELKSTCLFYLTKMGMVYALREDYNSFLQEADPKLIVIVVNACLDA